MLTKHGRGFLSAVVDFLLRARIQQHNPEKHSHQRDRPRHELMIEVWVNSRGTSVVDFIARSDQTLNRSRNVINIGDKQQIRNISTAMKNSK